MIWCQTAISAFSCMESFSGSPSMPWVSSTGFKTAPEFAVEPIGAALLDRIAGLDHNYPISYDAHETISLEALETEADEPLMDAGEAAPYLAAAVAAGVLSPAEGDLIKAIMAGRELMSAMGDNLALRRRLKSEFDGDLAAYVDELSQRAARFVAAAAGRP